MCVVHIDRYHWSYDTVHHKTFLYISIIFHEQTFSESLSVEMVCVPLALFQAMLYRCRRMPV